MIIIKDTKDKYKVIAGEIVNIILGKHIYTNGQRIIVELNDIHIDNIVKYEDYITYEDENIKTQSIIYNYHVITNRPKDVYDSITNIIYKFIKRMIISLDHDNIIDIRKYKTLYHMTNKYYRDGEYDMTENIAKGLNVKLIANIKMTCSVPIDVGIVKYNTTSTFLIDTYDVTIYDSPLTNIKGGIRPEHFKFNIGYTNKYMLICCLMKFDILFSIALSYCDNEYLNRYRHKIINDLMKHSYVSHWSYDNALYDLKHPSIRILYDNMRHSKSNFKYLVKTDDSLIWYDELKTKNTSIIDIDKLDKKVLYCFVTGIQISTYRVYSINIELGNKKVNIIVDVNILGIVSYMLDSMFNYKHKICYHKTINTLTQTNYDVDIGGRLIGITRKFKDGDILRAHDMRYLNSISDGVCSLDRSVDRSVDGNYNTHIVTGIKKNLHILDLQSLKKGVMYLPLI